MAHPSAVLPQELYILNGSNDLTLTGGKYVVAIYNPTAAAVTVDITGAITTYDSGYKPRTTEVTGVPIPTGGYIYGRFTNVESSAANVICYVN